MIVSVVLRNYKTYSKASFIPITSNSKYCGLIGNNGIGKSTVLEAMNVFFNKSKWNANVAVRKKTDLESYIIPVFWVDKFEIKEDYHSLLELVSDYLWNFEPKEYNSSKRHIIDSLVGQREFLRNNFNSDSKFLIPLGLLNKNNSVEYSLGPFLNENLGKRIQSHLELLEGEFSLGDSLKEIGQIFQSLYTYVYIPRDISHEDYLKLEQNDIQTLMDEDLAKVIKKVVGTKNISSINAELNKFIKQIEDELEEYSFRTSERRQTNIKQVDIQDLIIGAFFKKRSVYKKFGDHYLQIADLSSGEKQRAVINIAYNLITKHRDESNNLIFAIDEPESSLHISACFEQFTKLFELSNYVKQIIFTTHWYGYIPVSLDGSVTSITKKDNIHVFNNLDIHNYREQIKKMREESKGILPYDIRLKGVNDLIQTIINSLIDSKCNKWLICEGSSEKIYLNYFLQNKSKEMQINILPVGGSGEVRRIYNHFEVAIKDVRSQINGKIFFLVDTDANFTNIETRTIKNCSAKRIVNYDKSQSCKLVEINANPKAPETDIEKVLPGRLFVNTLIEFESEYKDLQKLKLGSIDLSTEKNSHYIMDLKPSEQRVLNDFFSEPRMKFLFAQKFVEVAIKTKSKVIPNWVSEIKSFLTKQSES